MADNDDSAENASANDAGSGSNADGTEGYDNDALSNIKAPKGDRRGDEGFNGLMGGARVMKTDLNTEMRDSYLAYAISVIVERALPDVRDGLKPVHRREIGRAHV